MRAAISQRRVIRSPPFGPSLGSRPGGVCRSRSSRSRPWERRSLTPASCTGLRAPPELVGASSRAALDHLHRVHRNRTGDRYPQRFSALHSAARPQVWEIGEVVLSGACTRLRGDKCDDARIGKHLLSGREFVVQRFRGDGDVVERNSLVAGGVRSLFDKLHPGGGPAIRRRSPRTRTCPCEITGISAHLGGERIPYSTLVPLQIQIFFHQLQAVFGLFI